MSQIDQIADALIDMNQRLLDGDIGEPVAGDILRQTCSALLTGTLSLPSASKAEQQADVAEAARLKRERREAELTQ